MKHVYSKTHVVIMVGTRPEAIKMAPVMHKLKEYSEKFETTVVATAQHRQMLDQALAQFKIKPDIDMDLMRANQGLSKLTCRLLENVEATVREIKPDIVLVQGDTTTAFISSLIAFYKKIPVAHVESGLRSHDIYKPFPEEVNRRLTTIMAEIHFAPTPFAKTVLLKEGVSADKIVITGNTVVDALQYVSKIPFSFRHTPLKDVDLKRHRIVLVTSHRRESWGKDFENICKALKDVVCKHSDVIVIFPVHPNPVVRSSAKKILAGQKKIYLINSLDYVAFINLMKKSYIILTDSGGVQEEAPTMGKPLLVMRDVTERPEGLHAGVSKLIGTKREKIVQEVSILLDDENAYQAMTVCENPYGDGRAAQRIVRTLTRWSAGKKPLCEPSEEFNPHL
jgi:UDP-N-acetylglucosamine 2-epimerase (non-hydrolysing)